MPGAKLMLAAAKSFIVSSIFSVMSKFFPPNVYWWFPKTLATIHWTHFTVNYSEQLQGRFYGGPGGRPPMKNVAPSAPLILAQPSSLDFHLNRPVISLIQLQNTVISLIQLHIVAPGSPSWNCGPPLAPIWLVPEPPLSSWVLLPT